MDASEFVALWKAEKNAYLVQLQGNESAAQHSCARSI